MKPVLAIDPGTRESGVVVYSRRRVTMSAIMDNEELLVALRGPHELHSHLSEGSHLAIEMIASYGMPVGADVFQTCVWIGRFIEGWSLPHTLVFRKDVKMCLCGTMKAKDANIRQALIDRFEPTGGGKTPQIGTKKQKGPLFGVKAHAWAALAVAVTFMEAQEAEAS